jgi:hypothetical protein
MARSCGAPRFGIDRLCPSSSVYKTTPSHLIFSQSLLSPQGLIPATQSTRWKSIRGGDRRRPTTEHDEEASCTDEQALGSARRRHDARRARPGRRLRAQVGGVALGVSEGSTRPPPASSRPCRHGEREQEARRLECSVMPPSASTRRRGARRSDTERAPPGCRRRAQARSPSASMQRGEDHHRRVEEVDSGRTTFVAI